MCLASSLSLHAQTYSADVDSSFVNPVGESAGSTLLTNNNPVALTSPDLPTGVTSLGADGAAFFWGDAVTGSFQSALWFEPVDFSGVVEDQYFDVGNLYYRNGTISSDSGASSVNILLDIGFTTPTTSIESESYTAFLINSTNTADPIASADIVSITNASPLSYLAADGTQLYLELTFEVDLDATDGSLSTIDEFRVFEEQDGVARLRGRITTNPVPEPGSLLFVGVAFLISLARRKR